MLAIKEINQQEHENKKKLDSIRKELKKSDHIFAKSESREIRKNLHNIEKRKQFDSKKTKGYLDKLDKKHFTQDKYYHYDYFEYRGIKTA